MNFHSFAELFNYGLVLIFGMFLSTFIAGSWETPRQRNEIILACPLFLIIQWFCWSLWGAEVVEKIYPFITHLPLLLVLVFLLKKKTSVAAVSILTSYFCCEIPLWINLMVLAVTKSALIAEICYTAGIIVLFIVFYRYFVPAIHNVLIGSQRSVLLFGSLPMAYYIFDYATTVYTDVLYKDIRALDEFLPTLLLVFYILLLTAYHTQQQKRTEAELRHSMLEAELKQSETEIENLHKAEKQTAIYQHDMRHHLRMIDHFIAVGEIPRAREYIQGVCTAVETVTPKRFCENETVNLLLSSFEQRANNAGIRFRAEVKLPGEHPIPDTELCAVISNGLDNALRAAEQCRGGIDFYCGIRHNKILIEIKNPYRDEITFRNELPVAKEEGHGYGCKSIRDITQKHSGICTFEAQNNIFTLRVVLPLQ